METTTIHHAAFRMAEALAICGAAGSGELSLDADRVTCPDCRRICGLGPTETP